MRADQLRVGHFIKINHRWFDHPFLHSTFLISSEDEITIIRNAGLTRLFVDHARSVLAAAPVASQKPADDERKLASVVAKLMAEKVERIDLMQGHREALHLATSRYTVTVERAHALMAMLNATDSGSADTLGVFVDSVVNVLTSGSAPLALVAAAAPLNEMQRIALLSTDAVGLCGAMGKQLGLSAEELKTLATAAALHLAGLQRLPAHLVDENPAGAHRNVAAFRDYPLLSAQIMGECSGFSEDVIRVVREHRERPDGTGFPAGLQGDSIHPLALILGAVREFQVRCSGAKAEPVQALAHMHRNMRAVYGDHIINNFVATMTVYPPGTFVLLSDGSIAKVLRINEDSHLRPVVSIIESNPDEGEALIVDLTVDKSVEISGFADRMLLPRSLVEQRRNTWAGVANSPATNSNPGVNPPVLHGLQASGA